MDKTQQKPKQACQICKKKFGGVFSNEHQCKRCLRTVCRQCCSKKKSVFTKSNTKIQQHRCCDICWPQSQAIIQYIKSHALVFNAMSKQGKQWAELAEIEVVQTKSVMSLSTRNSTTKSKLQGVYFHDIWAQMTPSLRQLSGLLVSKTSLGNVDTAIRYVGQKMGSMYSQTILPLIVYLLCHCDSTGTIKIASYLTKISTSFNQKNISSYIQYLSSTSEPALDQKSTKSIVNYCKSIDKFYIMTYFANCSHIDVIHHLVFQTLLSGDSGILQLSMAIVIYEFKKQILGGVDKPQQIRNTIWQTINLKSMEKSVKKLRKIIVKNNGIKSTENTKQQQPQQFKKQRSIASLSRTQNFPSFSSARLPFELEEPTQTTNTTNKTTNAPLPNIQQIQAKLQEASQFLQKMEQNQLQQNICPQNMEQLQKYLDMVIQDNESSLKQYQLFQQMLAAVEGQLYGNTTKINQN